MSLSTSRLRGKIEIGYKDQLLMVTGFLNFSHFPEYFLLISQNPNIFLKQGRRISVISHYKTVPSPSLPLRVTGQKEQRERGKQTLLLQPKVVVLNSWLSFEHLHLQSHHTAKSHQRGC